jgi:hypothetical protein
VIEAPRFRQPSVRRDAYPRRAAPQKRTVLRRPESSRMAFERHCDDCVVMSHSISIILLMQSSGKYVIHFKMLFSERLTASA